MKNDVFEILVDSTANADYPAQVGPVPPAIALENIYGFSVTVTSLGGQSGTLKFQVSNSPIETLLQDPSSAIWFDLPSGSFTISGAATQGGNFDAVYYRWLRVDYAKTAGTGNITCQFNLKGA